VYNNIKERKKKQHKSL